MGFLFPGKEQFHTTECLAGFLFSAIRNIWHIRLQEDGAWMETIKMLDLRGIHGGT